MIVIDHPLPHSEPTAGPIAEPLSSRRKVLLAGLGAVGAVLAGGCVSPSLELMGAPFSKPGSLLGRDGYALSDEQIDAIPYASMGVRIGGSAPVVMILASINGAMLHWASADRVVLITERGRLVKTIGMPRDLLSTRWTGADSLLPVLRRVPGADDARLGRIIDLRPKDDFSVPVESRCEWLGEETLTLVGRTRRTVLLGEHVKVSKWRWKAENRYWFDIDSGLMLKSRQQYCPEVAAITMEVLKPAIEPPPEAV